MKAHIRDLVAKWEAYGVPEAEQRQAAPWAFVEPVEPPKPGCRLLPEDMIIRRPLPVPGKLRPPLSAA